MSEQGERTADLPPHEVAVGGDEPLAPSLVAEPSSKVDLSEIVGAAPVAKSASGAKPNDSDQDEGEEPRSKRRVVMAALVAVVIVAIALVVVLGHFNSQRFLLVCEPDRIVAQQGRSFPPWGESELADPAYAPIVVPRAIECSSRESEDRNELDGWFLTALIDQATLRLTSHNPADVDVAAAQLDQALLLTRNSARRDSRKEVERLVGDVEYWRSLANLRSTSDALLKAAEGFEQAAQKRPRHVTDAAAWAAHVRKLVNVLKAGPLGEPSSPGGSSESPRSIGSSAPLTTPPPPAGSAVIEQTPLPPNVPASPPETSGGVLL